MYKTKIHISFVVLAMVTFWAGFISGMGNYIKAADSFQPSIEQAVTLEGEFTNAHTDNFVSHVRADVFYIKDTAGQLTRLFFVDPAHVPATGDIIMVTGLRNQAGLSVSSYQILSHRSLQSEGSSFFLKRALAAGTAKKVAVILFNFTNDTSQPDTAANFRSAIFTNSDSANAYYQEVSRSKISLAGFSRTDGDFYGWYTIAYSSATCDFFNDVLNNWSPAARAKAQADGYVQSNYTNTIYLFPHTSSCGWGGAGEVGGDESWVNYQYTLTNTEDVVMHELGHNFNDSHAGSYSCSDSSSVRVSISSSCTLSEYGDPFDVMGDTYHTPWPYHINNFHLGQSGWLDTANTQTATTNGDYTLQSPEQTSSGVQMIKIPRPGTGDYYYLEYRRPYGIFDNFGASDPAVNGISIRLAWDYASNNATRLIDATPSTAGFNDAALALNQVFYDPDAKIAVSNISMSSSSVTARIAFNVSDTVAPTGTISINNGASSTTSASVTLNLSCTDSATGCSQMQFSNDDAAYSNFEAFSATKSWTLASGTGTKTVYVKYKDGAGNVSSAFSDTITIADNTAPTGAIAINSGATSCGADESNLTCGFTCNAGDYLYARAWDKFMDGTGYPSIRASCGGQTVNCQTQNQCSVGPSPSPVTGGSGTCELLTSRTAGFCNSQETYTSSSSVTLNLYCLDWGSGCSQMQFSNDGSTYSALEMYASSKVWTLASGAGTKTVYVKYKDASGNLSPVFTDTIILDSTAPTGTISINSGAASTTSTSVTLTLSCSDSGSSCSQMQFSNDNSTYSAFEAYATSKSWTLTSGDGTKTVYVKYKDAVGNVSAAFNDTITLSTPDTVAPTGTVSINSGAASTNSTSATLTLTCSDSASGCSQMQFSNDNSTYSTLETYATSKSWTLSAGDGTKTVYVKYKDAAGNISAAFNDTITLDSTAPAAPGTPDMTAASDSGSSSTDNITSITTPSFAISCETGSTVTLYDSATSVGSGTCASSAVTITSSALSAGTHASMNAKQTDSAGNVSPASPNLSITIDSNAPAGTILINSGAASTNSTAVTLALSCSDSGSSCSQMQFSNDNSTYSTLETFATTKSWTLTSGDGTKTVYVKYKDTAGNVSTAFNDAITLDSTAPTGTISINNGASSTNKRQVTLNLSCSDSGSGCSQMQFSNEDGTYSVFETYATTKSWNLSTSHGTKTVNVKYKDAAGNTSAAFTDTITY